MFINAIPDNKGNKDGYYCSLIESYRENGVPKHRTIISFGFIPSEKVPYLKAAFNRGNPESILKKEKLNQQKLTEQRVS